MHLKKFLLQSLLVSIFAGCAQKNPYTPEKIVFVAPMQDIIGGLHNEFKFDTITFSGLRLEVADSRTIDLRVAILNPSFKENEIRFAYLMAKKVKGYVKNIDNFNVISIDLTFRKENGLNYVEKTRKVLFDQAPLKLISATEYFNRR